MRVQYLCLIATLLTVGCATQPQTPADIAAAVVRQDSPFDVVTRYRGPTILEYVSRGMLNDHVRWYVTAVTRKGGTTAGGYSLVASIWHQDRTWRFYRSASFHSGMTLPATRVDAKPSCMGGGGYVSCSFEEVVRVNLAQEQWDNAKSNGLPVRLNADRGPAVVILISTSYANGIDAGIAAKTASD